MIHVFFLSCGVPLFGLLLTLVGLTLGISHRNPHIALALGLLGMAFASFGAGMTYLELRSPGRTLALNLVPLVGLALGLGVAAWGAERASRGSEPAWRGPWFNRATSVAALVVALATLVGCPAGFLLGSAYPEFFVTHPEDYAEDRLRERGRELGLLYGPAVGFGVGAVLALVWLCSQRLRQPGTKEPAMTP